MSSSLWLSMSLCTCTAELYSHPCLPVKYIIWARAPQSHQETCQVCCMRKVELSRQRLWKGLSLFLSQDLEKGELTFEVTQTGVSELACENWQFGILATTMQNSWPVLWTSLFVYNGGFRVKSHSKLDHQHSRMHRLLLKNLFSKWLYCQPRERFSPTE